MPCLEVEVVDVEPDRLGDPGPGAVEHLQQRPVAQRQRRARRAGRLEDPLDVRQRQRLGQPLGRRRRPDGGRRGRPASSPSRTANRWKPRTATTVPRGGSPRSAADGPASPSRRRDQERRRPSASRTLVELVDPASRQVAGVPPQVAPVGRQGVVGQPALDHQVVEVGPDRPHHLARAGDGPADRRSAVTRRLSRARSPARRWPARAPRRPERWSASRRGC